MYLELVTYAIKVTCRHLPQPLHFPMYRFLRFRPVRMMSPDRRICMVKAGDPSGCLRSCLRVPQCLSIPQVNGRPCNIKERQRSLRATMWFSEYLLGRMKLTLFIIWRTKLGLFGPPSFLLYISILGFISNYLK